MKTLVAILIRYPREKKAYPGEFLYPYFGLSARRDILDEMSVWPGSLFRFVHELPGWTQVDDLGLTERGWNAWSSKGL